MTWSPHNLSARQETSKILSKNDPKNTEAIIILTEEARSSLVNILARPKSPASIHSIRIG
jgi:hypothetical protein